MAEFNEIVKDLQNNKISPIYFLQGEESFYIDTIVNFIEENLLDEAQKSFNQYVLYGKETDLVTILNAARKFPMMGERQVVIVKEAQELGDWRSDDKSSMLLNYLDNPQPSTVLVFAYKYKTLDKRKKLGKEIEKKTVFLNTKKISDYQLPSWIQSYAEAKGIKLSSKAVMLLSENIGNNLQRLANEMDKLSINTQAGCEITENDVHKHVGISKEYNVFELQDALSSGNHSKAQKIIDFFSANPSKYPVVLTIFNLYSYFQKILQIHSNGVYERSAVQRLLGLPGFVADGYIRAARRFPIQKALINIELIHRADLKSKGIGYNLTRDKENAYLKELIFQILNPN